MTLFKYCVFRSNNKLFFIFSYNENLMKNKIFVVLLGDMVDHSLSLHYLSLFPHKITLIYNPICVIWMDK